MWPSRCKLEDYYRDRGIVLAKARKTREAVELRHPHVEQHHSGFVSRTTGRTRPPTETSDTISKSSASASARRTAAMPFPDGGLAPPGEDHRVAKRSAAERVPRRVDRAGAAGRPAPSGLLLCDVLPVRTRTSTSPERSSLSRRMARDSPQSAAARPISPRSRTTAARPHGCGPHLIGYQSSETRSALPQRGFLQPRDRPDCVVRSRAAAGTSPTKQVPSSAPGQPPPGARQPRPPARRPRLRLIWLRLNLPEHAQRGRLGAGPASASSAAA